MTQVCNSLCVAVLWLRFLRTSRYRSQYSRLKNSATATVPPSSHFDRLGYNIAVGINYLIKCINTLGDGDRNIEENESQPRED